MACSCSRRTAAKWLWTGPDGSTVLYEAEIQAKAAVIRKGGTYARQG